MAATIKDWVIRTAIDTTTAISAIDRVDKAEQGAFEKFKARMTQANAIASVNVKTLADSAKTGIQTVSTLGGKLQSETAAVVKALMESQNKLAEHGAEVAEATGQTVEQVNAQTTETIARIQEVTTAIANVIALAADVPGKIKGIAGAFRSGDAAGGLTLAGDLTEQVGRALLSVPNPQVKLIGAVMVGSGLIAKAIAKVSELFKDKGKTELEIAQDRAKAEEALLGIVSKRLELVSKLEELGSTGVDQARERLEIQRQINAQYLTTSDLAAGMAAMSDEELAKAIQLREEEKALLQRGRSEWGTLAQRITEWESYMAVGNALLAQRRAERELEAKALEEEIDLLEFRNRLEGESAAIFGQIEAVRRGALVARLKEIDLTAGLAEFSAKKLADLASFTGEELERLLELLAAAPDSQLSPELLKLAESWLDATDAAKKFNDEQARGTAEAEAAAAALQAETEALRALIEVGRSEQNRAARMEAHRQRLLRGGASEEEISRRLAGLERFQHGGLATVTGPAILEAGELVLDPAQTRAFADLARAVLGGGPSGPFASAAAGGVQRGMMARETALIQIAKFVEVNQVFNQTFSLPTEAALASARRDAQAEAAEATVNTIQRAIQQGKLNQRVGPGI